MLHQNLIKKRITKMKRFKNILLYLKNRVGTMRPFFEQQILQLTIPESKKW